LKPAAFGYVDPETVGEVLDVLAEYGSEARLLAGGQSLVPLMNFRLARPSLVVDLNRVAGLDRIDEEPDGSLRIGAMVRQQTLECWAAERQTWGFLARALALIGHAAIRTRGTIGGSLAHADPAAELPAVLLCLDGEVIVRRRDRLRVIAAANFFRGPLTTALEPDELLVEVRFKAPPMRGGWAFEEVARRHGDFALVGVAACAGRAESGELADVRLALFGVADTPLRAIEAERSLQGKTGPSTSSLDEAVRLAAEPLHPASDLQASGAYRARVARVLVRRALASACRIAP
jgi:aerobic carbon-monoxide dehydrogenase medium subunit